MTPPPKWPILIVSGGALNSTHSLTEYKWAQECYKFVLNTMCDLIYDVISCCVWSDTGEINVYDKIII